MLSDLLGGAARCASCGKLSGHGAFARSMFVLACGGMVFSFAAAAMPDKYLQLYGFLPVLSVSVALAVWAFFGKLSGRE